MNTSVTRLPNMCVCKLKLVKTIVCQINMNFESDQRNTIEYLDMVMANPPCAAIARRPCNLSHTSDSSEYSSYTC